MPMLFKMLAAALALAASWLFLAAAMPTRLVEADVPAAAPCLPGKPLCLALHVRSLMPPDATPLVAQLNNLAPDSLIAALHAETKLQGLSLTGPVWELHLRLYPVSLEPTESVTLAAFGSNLSLPRIAPRLPERLPDAPQRIILGRQRESTRWRMIAVAVLVAVIRLAAAVWKHRLENPAWRIRRLAPTSASLDKLADILADVRPPVTPANHPEFFEALDHARFARQPPDSATIQALLGSALTLATTKR